MNTELVQTEPIETPKVFNKPSKKQLQFIEYWLTPSSDTFGNAYQSAIKAGFSKSTALRMTAPVRNVEWIEQAKAMFASLQPEHIYAGLQNEAINANASKDRIRAYELMAKIRGMFVDRSESTVNVTFRNDVPRPVKVIDVTPETPTEGKHQQIEGGS